MIAKIESRCQCVNVQRVNVCKAMRHPAKELVSLRIVDAARLFLSIYHYRCPLLSSLHSDGYFGIHSWTVDLDNLFFAYARLHEILRILLQHLVDKTYCEPLSVCRSVQRKMRNGSLTQGGKKLRSLGMFREAGRDLFEGTSYPSEFDSYRFLFIFCSHVQRLIDRCKCFAPRTQVSEVWRCFFPVNLSKLILLL